ncbi:MAG: hypothetical protein E6772_16535 [Dysgonomonas sp.]|nr:hypothetical protein [Dysgonomonas sp.]
MKTSNVCILSKYILAVALLFFAATASLRSQIGFPFFNSLKNIDPLNPGARGIGVPKPDNGSNSVKFTSEGVQLTSNEYSQFGAITLNNQTFAGDKGALITFEYMVYDKDDENKKSGGDGFTVFLFDANETNPGIGAIGGGLGYTFNRTNNSNSDKRARGVKSAYLGIGFDSYGNFKKLFYQGESRVNGVPFNKGVTGAFSSSEDPNQGNEITLRGAAHPQGLTPPGMGLGYSGYPTLSSQRTTEDVSYVLKTSGNYAYDRVNGKSRIKKPFAIRGGKPFDKPSDPGYRKAIIELLPNGNKGYYVSVMIQTERSIIDTVIYRYNYTQEVKYVENAIGSTISQGDNASNDDMYFSSPQVTLKAPAPERFKIGFAAATGDGSRTDPKKDTHMFKNLGMRLPRAAIALPDYANDTCKGARVIKFRPLENDYAYTGTESPNQVPCPKCIDGSTFRFLDDDGKFWNANTVTKSGVGKWTYTFDQLKDEGTVVFEPEPTFSGLATVQYDILGGKGGEAPYNTEAYRSSPATIGVLITEEVCIQKPIKIISNKMVRSKVVKVK